MRFETTTQRPVEASGVGLHSGVAVDIRILPASAGAGIVFVRTDLDGFPIPASWKYVARVSYATSLMRQGVLISTTEHLLSVFYGMGIDNAIVEISSLEAPILDGSGAPFVELLERAGRRQFRRKRRYLRIRRPVEVRDGTKRLTILPAEFSLESGELTPTLKVKRKVVTERYRRQIEEMYLKTHRTADYGLDE